MAMKHIKTLSIRPRHKCSSNLSPMEIYANMKAKDDNKEGNKFSSITLFVEEQPWKLENTFNSTSMKLLFEFKVIVISFSSIPMDDVFDSLGQCFKLVEQI